MRIGGIKYALFIVAEKNSSVIFVAIFIQDKIKSFVGLK